MVVPLGLSRLRAALQVSSRPQPPAQDPRRWHGRRVRALVLRQARGRSCCTGSPSRGRRRATATRASSRRCSRAPPRSYAAAGAPRATRRTPSTARRGGASRRCTPSLCARTSAAAASPGSSSAASSAPKTAAPRARRRRPAVRRRQSPPLPQLRPLPPRARATSSAASGPRALTSARRRGSRRGRRGAARGAPEHAGAFLPRAPRHRAPGPPRRALRPAPVAAWRRRARRARRGGADRVGAPDGAGVLSLNPSYTLSLQVSDALILTMAAIFSNRRRPTPTDPLLAGSALTARPGAAGSSTTLCCCTGTRRRPRPRAAASRCSRTCRARVRSPAQSPTRRCAASARGAMGGIRPRRCSGRVPRCSCNLAKFFEVDK